MGSFCKKNCITLYLEVPGRPLAGFLCTLWKSCSWGITQVSLSITKILNCFNKIIDIRNPGKFLARLSLSFSSSMPTIDLPHPVTKKNVQPDITGIMLITQKLNRYNNTILGIWQSKKVTFSDGCSGASKDVLSTIANKLKVPEGTTVSAVQVYFLYFNFILSLTVTC